MISGWFCFNYSFQVQFPSQSSLSSCSFAKSKCHCKYLLLKHGNSSSVIASIMIILLNKIVFSFKYAGLIPPYKSSEMRYLAL